MEHEYPDAKRAGMEILPAEMEKTDKARLGECYKDIPECVTCRLDGCLTDGAAGGNVLLVSFGLFSIIRLVRPAEFLISATEYVIPDKECVAAEEDDPCALFRSMAFPIAEFSSQCYRNPPPTGDRGGKCGC